MATDIAGKASNGHGNGANYTQDKVFPLDENLYDVDYEFFSALTGIKDPYELKKHILKEQAAAYAVSDLQVLTRSYVLLYVPHRPGPPVPMYPNFLIHQVLTISRAQALGCS